MMLTASWHVNNDKDTHKDKYKDKETSKKKGFMYKGIVTLCCNISI